MSRCRSASPGEKKKRKKERRSRTHPRKVFLLLFRYLTLGQHRDEPQGGEERRGEEEGHSIASVRVIYTFVSRRSRGLLIKRAGQRGRGGGKSGFAKWLPTAAFSTSLTRSAEVPKKRGREKEGRAGGRVLFLSPSVLS